MTRPIFRSRFPAAAVRLLWAVLPFLLIFTLTVAVSGEEEIPTVEAIPMDSPTPAPGSSSVDQLDAGIIAGWMSGSNLSAPTMKIVDGARCLTAAPLTGTGDNIYTVTRLYSAPDQLNLLTDASLSVILKVDGSDSYTVRLSLHSGMSTRAAEAVIYGGQWFAVRVDIADWQLRTAIDAVEISVTDILQAGIGSISVAGLTAEGEPPLETVSAFLTFGFTADGGTAEYDGSAYQLDAGQDGILTLLADAAREEYSAEDGGVTALRIVMENARAGGTVSLAVSDAFSGHSPFSIASSCRTQNGQNTYLLPFDSSMPLRAYRLSFRSLYADGGDSVRLLSVSLVHLPAVQMSADAGRLTDCTFSPDLSSLTVTGSIPSGTVAEHIDGTLALYEIPVWTDPETVLHTGTPLAVIKMTTRFSFTVSLTAREAAAALSRYAVVLLTEDRSVLITQPRFPDFPAASSRNSRSAVGLAGAEAAGVFAANASNVIVDVYADRLLSGTDGSTGGRLTVRGGRYYYLDYEYLRELDAEISFYDAADVDVYLRLLCAEDLSDRGFTFSRPGAGYFAFDVTNEDGAYMLSAITDYIASRYTDVRGFILGQRLDSAIYNGADMSDPDRYAALCADTMRVLYAAAAPHIPDVSVIAPLGHSLTEPAYDGQDACDPVLLSVFLSRHIEKDGGMPWGMLYISDSSAEMLGHTENILDRMKAVNAAVPDSLYFMWQPADAYDTDLLLSEYADRSGTASRLGARVFFIDAARYGDADNLYALLKHTEASGDSGRRLREFTAELLTEEINVLDYTGVYTLYDFTKSFSTLHWIAGSGCSSLSTRHAVMAERTRSMHAEFNAADGSDYGKISGSILCMMPATMDFTPAPIITCRLLVTSALESTDAAQLIFVFGSDDARAEYAVTVPVGQIVTVSCDLSAYGDATHISSAAILVQADSPVTLDVSHILSCSDTHTAAELTELFAGDTEAQADGFRFNAYQTAILLFTVAVSLSVFVLLSRNERNRENDGEDRRKA